MAFKAFRDENYFFVIDTVTGTENEGLAKDVRVRRSTDDSTVYYFDNVNGVDSKTPFEATELLDVDGVAYTAESWEAYRKANTGNFNSGGATPLKQYVGNIAYESGGFSPQERINTFSEPFVFSGVDSGIYSISGNGFDPAIHKVNIDLNKSGASACYDTEDAVIVGKQDGTIADTVWYGGGWITITEIPTI